MVWWRDSRSRESIFRLCRLPSVLTKSLIFLYRTPILLERVYWIYQILTEMKCNQAVQFKPRIQHLPLAFVSRLLLDSLPSLKVITKSFNSFPYLQAKQSSKNSNQRLSLTPKEIENTKSKLNLSSSSV